MALSLSFPPFSLGVSVNLGRRGLGSVSVGRPRQAVACPEIFRDVPAGSALNELSDCDFEGG